MEILKEIIINKPVKDSWKVLGIEFADVSKWASPVNHSEGSGKELNGSNCSERGCSTSMGGLREILRQYDEKNYTISYDIVEGLPSFVKHANNNWKLIDMGNKSKLIMEMSVETIGLIGIIMGPLMKLSMSKMAGHLAEDFKYYVENGNPHPRKIKAMNKMKQ